MGMYVDWTKTARFRCICREGKTVAVRYVKKKDFSLTKSIRKEVKEVRWAKILLMPRNSQ